MVRVRQSGPREPQTSHLLAFGPQDAAPLPPAPEKGMVGPVHSLQSPRTGVGGSSPLSGPASLLIPGLQGLGNPRG